jgi:hypothetical protein
MMELGLKDSAIVFNEDGTMSLILPATNEMNQDELAPSSMVAATKVMVALKNKKIWNAINKDFEKQVQKAESSFDSAREEKL